MDSEIWILCNFHVSGNIILFLLFFLNDFKMQKPFLACDYMKYSKLYLAR